MSVARTTPGLHLGGLLGAGSLMLVLAGCAFLQSYQHETRSDFISLPASSALVVPEPGDGPPVAELGTPPVQAEPPMAEMVPLDQPVPIVEPPALPEIVEPAILQTEQVAVAPPPARPAPPPGLRPAQAETFPVRRAEFIVKFRANDAIDDVIATWRRDRAGAEATFAEWAASDPLFSQMTIAGCSYSGELILATEVGGGPLPAEAEVDALIQRIRSHSAVAYADPDFTAHPGAQEN